MLARTASLKNGAQLPLNPSHTTALKITKYGEVRDAHDDHPCMAGLHESDIRSLMIGNTNLNHLYRFAMKKIGEDVFIFHTRPSVYVEVECEPV